MRAVYVVAALAFAGRLALYAGLDLYVDEAYYWTWSLRPAFGYLDHPPMVAYLAWLSHLLPWGELGLRAPFALCGALTIVFAAHAARAVSDRPSAPLLAALLAATVPMLTIGGALALPDAPLNAAFTAATCVFLTVRGRGWLLVGLATGLALLSKYSAGLLLFSVLAAAALDPAMRAELRTRWPWIGALVAGLVFAPCLAWNIAHGLVSIRFQVLHAFAGKTTSAVPAYVGGVIGGLGPIVLVAAVLFFARTRTGPARRLLAVTAVPLLVTAGAALSHRVHPNWPALVYPGLCAAAGAFAATLGTGARRAVVGTSVAIGVGLAIAYGIELREPRLFNPSWPPIERFHGWRDVVTQVRQAVGDPAPFVAPSNYQEAAQLAYYGNFRRFGPTFERRSQFTMWNDVPAAGERVVVVSRQPPRTGVAERLLGRPAAPPVKLESFLAGVRVRKLFVTMPEDAPPSR
jgi:4-amino-4-deoxy-L-arabinose transferase-like glycosyltransferase